MKTLALTLNIMALNKLLLGPRKAPSCDLKNQLLKVEAPSMTGGSIFADNIGTN